MAARAYWKGHLRLSLVTVGIELFSASATERKLELHQIHKPSGKRIRYEKVVPGMGPVDTDEIVRGFKTDEGDYVILEPDEIEALKLESKSTINLVQFVDHCEIDPRYFNKPYYVVPAGKDVDQDGFAVIRDALSKAKKVALGQMAARGRDYIVAIKPCGDGLLLETLRYAEEIREADRIFDAVEEREVDTEMLDLAGELIERKSAPFKPEAFSSSYQESLRDLIEEKRKTGHVSEGAGEDERPRSNVVDLMDALKKSVADDGKGAKKPAARRSSSSRSSKSGGTKSSTKGTRGSTRKKAS